MRSILQFTTLLARFKGDEIEKCDRRNFKSANANAIRAKIRCAEAKCVIGRPAASLLLINAGPKNGTWPAVVSSNAISPKSSRPASFA